MNKPPFDPNDLHVKLPERPNVIWIFGDQHRGQALGFMGDPNISTPNIDRMAIEGVAFPNAVGGYPLCCPYRGALLAGRYPHQVVPGHEYPFPDGMPTIAQPFNDAGYDTAYFGKWHVDGFKERNGRAAWHTVPQARRGGFRTWIGYENNNSQYDCWVHGHDADGSAVPHYRLPGYETDELSELLIDFIHDKGGAQAEGRREPFFAVLSVQPPHSPNLAPEDFMDRHAPGQVQLRPNVPDVVADKARRDLAGYYAQIENLDWNVGRVREAIAEAGLEESTYIIFFSDHGDMMGSHGHFAKNSPHEESIRVPFVMTGATPFYGMRHGLMHDAPVNHVDVGPTSLGLCGLEIPEWMQGTDYSGCMLPNRPKIEYPDSAYLQQVIPTLHGPSPDRPWRGIVTRDGWKYACLEGQPWMLYNVKEDPYEQRNMALYGYAREKRRELHERLAQWIKDTDDEFTLPQIWHEKWG